MNSNKLQDFDHTFRNYREFERKLRQLRSVLRCAVGWDKVSLSPEQKNMPKQYYKDVIKRALTVLDEIEELKDKFENDFAIKGIIRG